jgi:hypothetical protein
LIIDDLEGVIISILMTSCKRMAQEAETLCYKLADKLADQMK